MADRHRARALQCERRTGDGDGFHQLGAVIECIYQPRDAGVGIEFATNEMEGTDRVAIEHRHALYSLSLIHI